MRAGLQRWSALLDRAVVRTLARPWRSVLLVGLGSLVLGGMASAQILAASIERYSSDSLGAGPHLVLQRMQGGRTRPLPAAWAAEVARASFAVAQVRPRVWGFFDEPEHGATYTVMDLDAALDTGPGGPGAALLARGRWPRPAEAGVVVLGSNYARRSGLGPGATLVLPGPAGLPLRFGVVGELGPVSAPLTEDLLLMPSVDARRVLGFGQDEAQDLAVWLSQPDAQDEVAGRITLALPELRALGAATLLRSQKVALSWRLGILALPLLLCWGALLLLVLDLGGAGLDAERREIGLLRALGWSVADVVTLQVFEASLPGLLTYALALGLAALHLGPAAGCLLRPWLGGWAAGELPLSLPLVIEPGTLLGLLLVAVVPYVVARVLPRWRLAAGEPAAVLRP